MLSWALCWALQVHAGLGRLGGALLHLCCKMVAAASTDARQQWLACRGLGSQQAEECSRRRQRQEEQLLKIQSCRACTCLVLTPHPWAEGGAHERAGAVGAHLPRPAPGAAQRRVMRLGMGATRSMRGVCAPWQGGPSPARWRSSGGLCSAVCTCIPLKWVMTPCHRRACSEEGLTSRSPLWRSPPSSASDTPSSPASTITTLAPER